MGEFTKAHFKVVIVLYFSFEISNDIKGRFNIKCPLVLCVEFKQEYNAVPLPPVQFSFFKKEGETDKTDTERKCPGQGWPERLEKLSIGSA